MFQSLHLRMSSFGVPSSTAGLDLTPSIAHAPKKLAGNRLVPHSREAVELVGMEEEEMDMLGVRRNADTTSNAYNFSFQDGHQT